MKSVIITGADGFVGSYTVKKFIDEGIEVTAVDIADKPNRLKIDENLTYVKCNVSDIQMMEDMIPAGEYDTFIHFAWRGSAGKERNDYNLQMRNALDTVECMRLAGRLGCRRFLCAGSIMEYEAVSSVHAQGSRPGMGYIYGMGKHIAHCLCKSVAADIGIELVWPIITNAYGEGEYSPRFVNTTIRKIINREPLKFTAATQNYDFVYVTDVARAFYMIAENGKPFCEYMIGSSNARPLKEFIIEMQEELAPDMEPVFGDIPFTGINMPLSTFDTGDTERDCGFKAEISFAEGTRKTMQWLKSVGGADHPIA